MTNKNEDKPALWQSHLESWKQSGLSQKAYCALHKLKPHQFWYWKRKLDPQTHSSHESTTSVAKPPAFVPVRLSSGSPGNSGVSLELPGGIRIHHITSDTCCWLRDLIREVSGS